MSYVFWVCFPFRGTTFTKEWFYVRVYSDHSHKCRPPADSKRFLVSEREYRRAFDTCGLRQVGVRHTLDNQIGNSNMFLSIFGNGTKFLS